MHGERNGHCIVRIIIKNDYDVFKSAVATGTCSHKPLCAILECFDQ